MSLRGTEGLGIGITSAKRAHKTGSKLGGSVFSERAIRQCLHVSRRDCWVGLGCCHVFWRAAPCSSPPLSAQKSKVVDSRHQPPSHELADRERCVGWFYLCKSGQCIQRIGGSKAPPLACKQGIPICRKCLCGFPVHKQLARIYGPENLLFIKLLKLGAKLLCALSVHVIVVTARNDGGQIIPIQQRTTNPRSALHRKIVAGRPEIPHPARTSIYSRTDNHEPCSCRKIPIPLRGELVHSN